MRKIKFKLLTQNELFVLETSARTFGELQQEVKGNSSLSSVIKFGNNQFIDHASKHQFGSIPEAILPPNDCLMHVVPLENKSGYDCPDVEEIEEMGYKELRTLGSNLNKENSADIDLSGKKDDILKRVLFWVKSQPKPECKCEVESDVREQIAFHATKIVELTAKLPVVKPMVEEKVVFKTTYAEAEEEAQRLKALLNKEN